MAEPRSKNRFGSDHAETLSQIRSEVQTGYPFVKCAPRLQRRYVRLFTKHFEYSQFPGSSVNLNVRHTAGYLMELQMNMTQNTNRIHPLMAVAAVSVTLVSLLGIAALTGVLPNSHGSASDTAQPAGLLASAPAQAASAPLSSIDEAAPHKPIAHHHTQKPATLAQAHPAQVTQVEPAQPYSPSPSYPPAAPAAHNSPVGIGVGAVAGGLLGSQVGGGTGKTLATIAGAVGGGYLGNEVAKKNQ